MVRSFQSFNLRWWWSYIFRIAEIPQLIFWTIKNVLANSGSILFFCLQHIQAFSTVCINDVLFWSWFGLINPEFLIWLVWFRGCVYSCSILIAFYCQVLSILLTFYVKIWTLLNHCETLVFACVPLP